MTNTITDAVYAKVFNDEARTFHLNHLSQTWQKEAGLGVKVEVWDVSGAHVETLKFQDVLLADRSLFTQIEDILISGARKCQSYASLRDSIIGAIHGAIYTCDETVLESTARTSPTPHAHALPSKIVVSTHWAIREDTETKNRLFALERNAGTSRTPVLMLRQSGATRSRTFTVSPREIALYQAQLSLCDTDSVNSDSSALDTVARVAVGEEKEKDKEKRQRQMNMLMMMGMFG